MKKLFFAAFLLFFVLPSRVLELDVGGNTCFIFGDAKLSVEYTHSVSLTKVVDTYEINASGIYIVEERWQQFDAGQPINFDRIEDGYYVKSKVEYLGNSWQYWFIPINNASVKVGDRVFYHREGVLKFEVKSVPLVLALFRGC